MTNTPTPIGTAGPMQPATLQGAVETIGKLQGRIEKLEERPLSNVRITMRAHGKAEVYIDGIRAKGVSAFRLEAGVGGKNTLTLQYSAQRTDDPRSVEVDSVEVEGVAVVNLPSGDED